MEAGPSSCLYWFNIRLCSCNNSLKFLTVDSFSEELLLEWLDKLFIKVQLWWQPCAVATDASSLVVDVAETEGGRQKSKFSSNSVDLVNSTKSDM